MHGLAHTLYHLQLGQLPIHSAARLGADAEVMECLMELSPDTASEQDERVREANSGCRMHQFVCVSWDPCREAIQGVGAAVHE